MAGVGGGRGGWWRGAEMTRCSLQSSEACLSGRRAGGGEGGVVGGSPPGRQSPAEGRFFSSLLFFPAGIEANRS